MQRSVFNGDRTVGQQIRIASVTKRNGGVGALTAHTEYADRFFAAARPHGDDRIGLLRFDRTDPVREQRVLFQRDQRFQERFVRRRAGLFDRIGIERDGVCEGAHSCPE